MKKNLILLALAAAVTAGLSGGCGKGDSAATASAEVAAKTATEEGPDEAPAREPAAQVLKVAAAETAYGAKIWEEVAKGFEALNPGVTVELTIDKKLEDVIVPGMQAGDYPDIIHRPVGTELALTETFIKDNAMEDITEVLAMTVPGENATVKEKIVPGFLDTSITNPYGDGKTYLAPMFYSPCGLFYNAGLFEEKGWNVPETWAEMWALGDIAKEEGISLFTYPTTGYFDAFYYALMYEAGGAEFFEKATHYEDGIWDSSEAEATFDVVEQLASYTDKSVPANANDENFTKNQQLILDNKALFIPNGSWLIGEMKDAPRADGFEWGFMALPALTEGGDRYSYTWFEQSWIPAAAENKDLAKQFIAYLYSDEAARLFYHNSPAGSPAVQPIVGISDMLTGDNKVYFSIYENGAKAAMGAFAATDAVEGTDVRSAWFDPINSLVSGDKTRDQWILGIKETSDILRSALK